MRGDAMHHVFDAPKRVIRLQEKTKRHVADHGWMTPAQARARILGWVEHAQRQGRGSANAQKVVLSLFDLTGQWAEPWVEAGYQVWTFDIQRDPTMEDVNAFCVEYFNDYFSCFEGNDVHAILSANPCTDFASSGARHFAQKDADGRTEASVELVKQTLRTVEFFRPAVWAIENPVGRIGKLAGLPPWRLAFDPYHVGDTYTKKTLLWGRFNADLPIAPVDPVEGSKMWSQYGGKSQKTKNARSQTPEGFAYSFFMANNAIDHPGMAIAGKYDRLNAQLIQRALDAGLTSWDIDQLVGDPYYMELDDHAAEEALRTAIQERAA